MTETHLTRTQVVQELTNMLRKVIKYPKITIKDKTTEFLTILKKNKSKTLVFPKKFNKQQKLQELYSQKHEIMSQLRIIRSNLVRIYTPDMEEQDIEDYKQQDKSDELLIETPLRIKKAIGDDKNLLNLEQFDMNDTLKDTYDTQRELYQTVMKEIQDIESFIPLSILEIQKRFNLLQKIECVCLLKMFKIHLLLQKHYSYLFTTSQETESITSVETTSVTDDDMIKEQPSIKITLSGKDYIIRKNHLFL